MYIISSLGHQRSDSVKLPVMDDSVEWSGHDSYDIYNGLLRKDNISSRSYIIVMTY